MEDSTNHVEKEPKEEEEAEIPINLLKDLEQESNHQNSMAILWQPGLFSLANAGRLNSILPYDLSTIRATYDL